MANLWRLSPLNNITVNDKYPIPHLRTLTWSLHGKTIFSKLDLQRTYLQIDVAPDDIPKTTVITPFGLFKFVKMAFGMKTTGSTFQRFMESIFSNVDNVFIYLDDILIASDLLRYLDTWSGFEAAKTAPWPRRGLHHCGKFLEPSDE